MNLTGMYGDLQGIAGKSLQEIEGLELKSLELSKTKSIIDNLLCCMATNATLDRHECHLHSASMPYGSAR